MGESKNEKAWELLADELDIIKKVKKDGVFNISAKEINKYREARLMTKFDHSSNLPKLFKKHNLAILPITRGDYIIGGFEAYLKVNYNNTTPTFMKFPSEITTIDFYNLYSEASAVNCAFVTGILKEILGETCIPTVNGRMASTKFEYDILNQNNANTSILVNNSQIEIDGGFESKNYFCILEAKNYMVDDFIIRQLYYPYRLWTNKIKKKVIPVFFTYSNNVFSFFIYEFEKVNNYNSIKLIEQKNYTLLNKKIEMNDLIDLMENTTIVPEPQIPFPQADNFERVIDLLFLLNNQNLTLEEITNNYDFDKRQASYYSSALMYLGLVSKKIENGLTVYTLSQLGENVMRTSNTERNLVIIKKIIEHAIFNCLLYSYIKNQEIPHKESIIEVMKNNELFNVDKNSSTLIRRAQTVQSWINWIISFIRE